MKKLIGCIVCLLVCCSARAGGMIYNPAVVASTITRDTELVSATNACVQVSGDTLTGDLNFGSTQSATNVLSITLVSGGGGIVLTTDGTNLVARSF